MAHAIGADQALGRYEDRALFGACLSAIAAFINPITGAAVGTYYVTNITTHLIADHFRFGESGQLTKIVRVALTTLASLGAAFATWCCLSGVALTLTPGMMAIGVSVLCVTILASLVRRPD